MNKIKWLIAIGCAFVLSACQEEVKVANVVKEGTLYEIGSQVSFYYPSDFSAITQEDLLTATIDTNSLQLQKNDELIVYSVDYDVTENTDAEKQVLYVSELEQIGATGITVSQPILESGITVYEITGFYNDISVRFKHIVYFMADRTYIYGYRANTETYEAQIDYITSFLKSITINGT